MLKPSNPTNIVAVFTAAVLLCLILFVSTGESQIQELNEISRLTAADGQALAKYGSAIALTDTLLAISASKATVDGRAGQGAVYLYQKGGGGPGDWQLIKKIVAPDGAAQDEFGRSLALDGDTLLVGAYLDDISIHSDRGAAYLFSRHQGGSNQWGLVKKLMASNGGEGDHFGWSVDLDGATAVVGAYMADVKAQEDQGAVYIFNQHYGGSNNWGEVKILHAADGQPFDFFGFAVAAEGQTVAAGAQLADIPPFQDQGAVYLFSGQPADPTSWTQSKKLTAPDHQQNDLFGTALALDGSLLAVGAYSADVNSLVNHGAVYLFNRDEGGINSWGAIKKLLHRDGAAGDQLGWSVQLTEGVLMVGAPGLLVNGADNQGGAFFFEAASNWQQTERLIAADGKAGDGLGSAVGFAGEIAVVGANYAAVNGQATQGAAHIFSSLPPGAKFRVLVPLVTR